ncbi:nuclear pore complex protein Nup85 isoform X2 [Neocloeon triangulifer]|uniref:nuclear pore complex protein Nup85 isoform X2 n=1 Tax=Neocloeon triangulifer TaxID=2078957 RepID=UPI00286F8B6D|nr:nuclear pore complex protein Nup85 isoform X2 [Neocloeon triangulifer]
MSKVRSRTVGRFVGLGRLSCHRTRVPRPEGDLDPGSSPAPFSEGGEKVTLVREDSALFEQPAVRTLLNNSHAVFSILQSYDLHENHTADTTFDHGYQIFDVDPSELSLVHASRAYRLFLRDCTLELQESQGADREHTQNLSALFYSVELIFHLAEILNIDKGQDSNLLPKLQEWMRYHFPESIELAEKVLRGRDEKTPIECHPDFWSAVTGLVVLGQVREARQLLGQHSKKETPAVRALRTLLHSKPDLKSSSGTSAVINFTVQWEAWRKEVLEQITSGVFGSNVQCLQLAELLAGDNKAFKLVYEQSETWYKFLVCYLTYWQPSVLPYQLGDHARMCMNMFEAHESRALDKILLSLCDCDLYQVIENLQEFAESGWAALHLTDLLFHAGRLSNLVSQDYKVAENLRQDLILQFGCLLASNDSLWRTGLSYLDLAGPQGVGQAELILLSRKPDSEANAEILLQESRKRNFASAEQVICTVVSRQHVGQRRLGSALMWAIRAENHGLSSSVAELILRQMAKDDQFSVADILTDLGTSIISSGYLVFLVKYNEYLSKYQQGSRKEAVAILIDLLTSGFAPPYFVPVLLKKAGQAAKDSVSEFSSADLCNILGVLEEFVVTAQINPSKEAKSALDSLESCEKEIREVLAQSICLAEVSELSFV